MIMAGIGPTKPDAGVIATNPATAPDEAPTRFGFSPNILAIVIHVTIDAEAAIFVTTNAFTASVLTANALPALNPNQPNHNIPAPNSTKGVLCGLISSFPNPSRGPKIIAVAKAATPELI